MVTTPNYSVPALEKGLDILETLAAAPEAQSLAELAGRLERSSSELFRMLNCLETRGYVTRDALSAKYALTLKVYALAHGHSVTEKLVRAASLPMQQLTAKVRESAHLSVIDRGRLLVVAQQESPERVRLSIEVGGIFDPIATASGRLLLAQMGADARAAVCAESAAYRALAKAGRTKLAATLAEMARTRFSVAEGETIEGVRDVAVLVGDPATGVMAALASTRLLRRGRRDQEKALVAALWETSAAINRALGFPPVL